MFVLRGTEKYLEDSSVTGHSQCGLTIGRSCLSSLISFNSTVTQLGKLVDVIVLDFFKDFYIVSHNVLLDKISRTQLDNGVTWWGSNWLRGGAQRVTGKG